MTPAPVTGNNRILIIDDNPEIHADFRKVLTTPEPASEALDSVMAQFFGAAAATAEQASFQLDSCYQGKEGLQQVERSLAEGRPYAMAFVDVRMPPGWDGVETITRIWEIDSSIQVVICTAYSDYSWQDIIARLGKSDRLVILKKPFDSIEVLQLAHAMTEKWLVTQQARQKLDDLNRLVGDRTRELQESNDKLKREMVERELAQQALRLSEERLSKAFECTPLPVAILRQPDHGYVEVNTAFLQVTGYERSDLVGCSFWERGVGLESQSRLEAMGQLMRGMAVRQRECRILTKSGEEHAALMWIERFELAAGPHLLAVVQDISEQQKLENQLRQSQKMEAIGHLAAGVAHDLNNILTVVEGHTSLQLAKKQIDSDVAWSLQQVQSAGQRAAALTRQLLAFGRKQIMLKRGVLLSVVIDDIASMLRRLIPENISITFHHTPEVPLIFADVCNLEQIIVNLVVNARDAMPGGGSLAIRTDETEVTAEQCERMPGSRPGRFVRLIVGDTGEGMSAETLARIFEPFFTTKEVGKGTGMGLATVLGIVQQHEGWIDAQSRKGSGTTFRIYFPATDLAVASDGPKDDAPAARVATNETILLVEDDADVRSIARCVLEEAGYRVMEAADGHDAIAAWQSFTGRIDLLLTDMVMPGGLSGSDVAKRFRSDRPDSKVIFSSGYSESLFGSEIGLREGVTYLPKPYLARQLTDTVARALSHESANAPGDS